MIVNTYLPEPVDLFSPSVEAFDAIKPWKPAPLLHHEWPPNYQAVYAWRIATLAKLQNDAELLAGAKTYYSTRPSEFIMHWMDTYDPRRSPMAYKEELRGSKWMPFVFFKRQDEYIQFLHEMRESGEAGLVEKARDMGATWGACGYSVWSWLFIPSDAIGWGSRKQELVDKIGDASSIFEKLRLLIRRLPDVFVPAGLKERDHLKSMNITNPENGSSIIGEIGRNIGRGGRTSMYFKDEAAHYEHPEDIQAALDDNTHVQIDISSVNGLGNVFHRRRTAGQLWFPGAQIASGFTRVFIADWSDHPEKTQAWYDKRKAQAEREGMQHIFAQEVDRDYASSQANRVIDAAWLRACIDAHLTVPYFAVAYATRPNKWMAGLDVADGGIDRNALSLREWIILRDVQEWGERDPGVTIRRAIDAVRAHKGIEIQADLIGVGSGVKTEYNRLIDDKIITRADVKLVFWNAGGAVVDPFDPIIPDDEEAPLNKDFFQNFKAQGWWSLRTRCYKTFKAVTEGAVYPVDQLISFDSTIPLLAQLVAELAQPVTKPSTGLKTMIDKAPEGTKSPNLADCTVQVFFPVPDIGGRAVAGGYNG